MAKMYKIDRGETFEGTFEQFNDMVGGVRNDEGIAAWCHRYGMKLEIYHTVDPVDPDQNPHDFAVAGYGNVTAIHPTGSYIGFSRGPTVFATPLVYLSEANDKLEDLAFEAELNSVHQMFKDVVAEAKSPASERIILTSCAIPWQWFNSKRGQGGEKSHLTDEYIDGLSLAECRIQMALFIANCFRQR